MTVNKMTLAISKAFKEPEKEASKKAEYIMDFFGYHERIIDHPRSIEPADRKKFYELTEKNILKEEWEEHTLYGGKHWRSHYWVIDHEGIEKIIANHKPEQESVSAYDTLTNEESETWGSMLHHTNGEKT